MATDEGPSSKLGLSEGGRRGNIEIYTAQKIKFFIKDFFSKCDQIRSFARTWSHLLKKSLMENCIFCAVLAANVTRTRPLQSTSDDLSFVFT